MILAAAQTSPEDKTTEENLSEHYRWIEKASEAGVDFLMFPEMSITGYQRENAERLAFTQDDQRLGYLAALALNHNMIIVAGAPIRLRENLFIGSFIIKPDGNTSVYTKQFLHDGEEKYFRSSFDFNPIVEMEALKVSLAICADIENPAHPQNAAKSGSTVYAANIFYSSSGINAAHKKLANYAETHKMRVLMSNFVGQHQGIQSGGKSAFWNNEGELIGELSHDQPGILIVADNGSNWELKQPLSKSILP